LSPKTLMNARLLGFALLALERMMSTFFGAIS
jgi:hypothetical protein